MRDDSVFARIFHMALLVTSTALYLRGAMGVYACALVVLTYALHLIEDAPLDYTLHHLSRYEQAQLSVSDGIYAHHLRKFPHWTPPVWYNVTPSDITLLARAAASNVDARIKWRRYIHWRQRQWDIAVYLQSRRPELPPPIWVESASWTAMPLALIACFLKFQY